MDERRRTKPAAPAAAPGSLGALEARVAALEARHDELTRRSELVASAGRQWRPVLAARGQLVVASDAGEVGHVPLAIVRTLLQGRPLDVDVRDAGVEHVELVDRRGAVVATLTRATLVALPRIAASAEVGRLVASMATAGVGSRSCSLNGPATDGSGARDSRATGPSGPVQGSRSSQRAEPEGAS